MTFDEYVRVQRLRLLRLATVLTGDGALAEDIVQGVLVRAFQRWARIGTTDLPHAYVRRMVVNEYLSWRRKWQRVLPMADLDDLLPPTPDHAEQHAERVALLQLVTRLPARQRAVVVLRYYEGLDDHEIAATLGCGESTVRSNMSRALTAMRVHLQTPTLIPARTETP